MDGQEKNTSGFTRITGDGQREAITAPAEVAELEQAVESIAQMEEKKVADAQGVLSALAPDQNDLAVPKEIDVNGEMQTFYIKRLTHTEISRLDAKKYRRGPNGQLIKDIETEETVALAWLFHLSVVRDVNAGKTDTEGQPLPPNWAPLWTVEQILGGKTPGLMQNPNPAAQDLLYALQAAIWDVSPAVNPILSAAAAQSMGLT